MSVRRTKDWDIGSDHLIEITPETAQWEEKRKNTRRTSDRIDRTAAADLLDAMKTILRGFETGVFVRNVRNDTDPYWAIKLLPFMAALSKAQAAAEIALKALGEEEEKL